MICFKCLMLYSEQELQFPCSLSVSLLTVLYSFVFLFHVEEHLSASCVSNKIFYCRSYGGLFLQLMYVWKSLYFSFISKG